MEDRGHVDTRVSSVELRPKPSHNERPLPSSGKYVGWNSDDDVILQCAGAQAARTHCFVDVSAILFQTRESNLIFVSSFTPAK